VDKRLGGHVWTFPILKIESHELYNGIIELMLYVVYGLAATARSKALQNIF